MKYILIIPAVTVYMLMILTWKIAVGLTKVHSWLLDKLTHDVQSEKDYEQACIDGKL